ncbi:MAG: hypothetical protein Q8L53_15900 [Aestuariivirga sp.]|nr:hypothetical protein [Aestuariivirga sp.]
MTCRILLGWEFGGGFGHIVHLREIARNLSQHQSCNFLFALRNPEKARLHGLGGSQIAAAPSFRRPQDGSKMQYRATYGEFIAENLMIDEGAFSVRLAAWDSIVRDFDPHLIIADYALGLNLYARGRWPVLAVGNGYTLPPPEMDFFPPIVTVKRPLYATEDDIAGRLNKDLKKIGALPIDRLPQINEANAYGLMTIPLFDPYLAQRRQPYLGAEVPGGMPAPRPVASGCIAYFHEDTQLNDNILDGLLGASINTRAYFSQHLRRSVKKTRGSRVSLTDKPFNLQEDMPGKAVAVHNGGLGFATAAVLAGVPQVMLYRHEEHWFTANAIVKAGAGVAARYRESTSSALSEAIDRVTSSLAMRENALRLAEENAGFRNANPTRAIADIAARLLS